MVQIKRDSGHKVYENNENNSFLLHSLTGICRDIKSSNHLFINNKAAIDELLLANLIRDLRHHYNVRLMIQ